MSIRSINTSKLQHWNAGSVLHTFVCAPFVLSSQWFYLLHISPLLTRISRQEYVDARIHSSEMDIEFTFKVVTGCDTNSPYASPNKFHDCILLFCSFVWVYSLRIWFPNNLISYWCIAFRIQVNKKILSIAKKKFEISKKKRKIQLSRK